MKASTQHYQAEKARSIANETIRKEINLSGFQVKSGKIHIDGVDVDLSPYALNRLMAWLQIPSSFAKRFEQGFGKEGLAQLIDMIKASAARKTDRMFTLVINPRERKIVEVLPPGRATISNGAFFELAERHLGSRLQPEHIGVSQNGDTVITASLEGSAVKIPGMEREIFSTGVQFKNSSLHGLEVSPYLRRLTCANGMTSQSFMEHIRLDSLSDHNIRRFNEHMEQLRSVGYRPYGLEESVTRAMNTPASMLEMEKMSNLVNKSTSWERSQLYVPRERAKRAYELMGQDLTEWGNKEKQTTKSGVSVWTLVNGVTNWASNEKGLSDWDRTNGMMQAGNYLMSQKHDLWSPVKVDPFKNEGLLSLDGEKRLMGEG
jgi:hypothetical protein